jgi:hypothetical protein
VSSGSERPLFEASTLLRGGLLPDREPTAVIGVPGSGRSPSATWARSEGYLPAIKKWRRPLTVPLPGVPDWCCRILLRHLLYSCVPDG